MLRLTDEELAELIYNLEVNPKELKIGIDFGPFKVAIITSLN